EKPEDLILDKYNIGSGDLLRLKENAEWLLYAVGEIAKIFGKDKILKIINDLKARVKYGVKQELLELAKLEGVGRIRARILYNAGYTTIEKLRSANQKDLERLPYFGPKIAEQIISQLRRI
ncbi:MAG: helix-hairpin-helix domain-containing protein, partial [Candidatus Asgardarchaeia archaeon]